MSIFNGLFSSLPGVSCDNFRGENEKSDQFFLSHCHSDHMVGLDSLVPILNRRNAVRVNHRIYCSMVSKVFILGKYPSLNEKILKDLFPNQVYVLDVFMKSTGSFYKLRVIGIPANHCPGSLMFKFEAFDKRIVYTGDFRFDNLPLQSIPSLHDSSSILPIDEMYLDTTFCHPGYEKFPTRQESEEAIWNLVDSWIKKNGKYRNTRPKHVVLFHLPAQYGSERLLKAVYERSGCKWRIHVGKRKFMDYLCSDDLGDCTSPDPNQWIHACSWKEEGKKRNRSFKFIREIPCQSGPLEVRSIRPSAMFFRNDRENSDEIVLRAKGQSYRVCYSSHSSMEELREFVKYFQPKKIIPCVRPPGMTIPQITDILYGVLKNNLENKDSLFCKLSLKRKNSEPYLSSSSSENDSQLTTKRRMYQKRAISGPVSKSEDTLVREFSVHYSDANKKNRRASLPHNLKIPAITITPSSPSPDPNHPDYPEFFENKLYLESHKNMLTPTVSSEQEDVINIMYNKSEGEDMDSTPELDEVFHIAKSSVERQNCINFAKRQKRIYDEGNSNN